MKVRVLAIPLLIAVVLAAAGCGGSDAGLPSAVQAKLTPLVENVRRAATSSDRAAANRALAILQQAVVNYETSHAISPARAAEILTAATEVQQRLTLVPTTSTTTTSTTTTTTTSPPAKEPGKGGKGKDHKDRGGD